MRALLTLAAVGTTAVAVAASPVGAGHDGVDDRVTGNPYVRHDGGTDLGIQHCNDPSTNPTPVAPTAVDADPNDGGSRRQGNEPFSVVDPTDPMTVVAGWNDYCLSDLGAGWQGFAYSRNGGDTWIDSMVPGYPQDTSAEGRASPLFGTHTDAGDPIAAFDRAGNLFVGGIAFRRTQPQNGDVYVATYGTNPPPCAATTCPGYPVDYLRTVVVGRGTPSSPNGGIFQDKPMLEVDRTGGPHDGNVYVCWSRFTGAGQNKVYFSRSTNHGASFSRPVAISRTNEVHSVQGCDIAIEHDGDVYVVFRTFNDNASKTTNALAFARSTDGGASFARTQTIRTIIPYNPFDTDRNCGDGPFHCPSDFVFHRVPLETRITADQTGTLPGVYIAYNENRPGSIVPSITSYSSAGAGRVGQSLAYVVRSLNNGAQWSEPKAVDAAPAGHQFFPDLDAHRGRLAVVWQDNRTDPAYSVQHPIGNTRVPDADGDLRAVSSGTNIVNSFLAMLASSSSTDRNAFAFGPSLKVSAVGHQSEYEMFGSRQLPFHGDYNWISLADAAGGVFAYMAWTDNRDVEPGDDPREIQEDGFDDNFDVAQCLVDLGAPDPTLDPDIPLFRRDAPFSGNNCGNNGGLDQNIYGFGLTLP